MLSIFKIQIMKRLILFFSIQFLMTMLFDMMYIITFQKTMYDNKLIAIFTILMIAIFADAITNNLIKENNGK